MPCCKPVPDTSVLLPLALIIGGTQILRGVLQFGRNFGAELMAQKVERDIREELYVSLLGKSMTFHSLQPVGDTMARATNDVREVNLHVQPRPEPGDRFGIVPGDAAHFRAALPPIADPDPARLYHSIFRRCWSAT